MTKIWTNGTKPEKSLKTDKNQYLNSNTEFTTPIESIQLRNNNTREILSNKLNEREYSKNVTNPFLVNNNYIQDLEIQNTFLIPQVSHNITT